MSNTTLQEIPLFIDSDNALGAPFGDIDDGFAIAAFLKSGLSIEALSTVFGNTFEPLVYRNTNSLAKVCGYSGRILRGAATWWSKETDASQYLTNLEHSVRALALGPMTNFALALKSGKQVEKHISELIFVGTNHSLPLPAFRFIDFNQWKDPRATRAVFDSAIPLTCVPCDVARKLRISKGALDAISGPLGEHLREKSARWFRRSQFLKGLSSVPVWDLVAAMYTIDASLFRIDETRAELGRMGQAVFGCQGGRPIRVIIDFNSDEVWNRFLSLVSM